MRAFGLLIVTALCLPVLGLAQTVPAPPAAPAYYGKWLGKVAGPAGEPVSLGVELFARADGTPGAVLVLPGQGLFNGLIDRVEIAGGHITLGATQAGLSLRLKATGHSLAGQEDQEVRPNGRPSGKSVPIELLPVQSFGEPVRRPPPPPPGATPYETQEIVVRTPDGIALSGTLTRPQGLERVATVVLIGDSGPVDRDGAGVAGHHPFAVLADYLGWRRMATFRYDQRGVRRSSGDFLNSTPEQLAADALAVVQALRAREDVGPVGLIGHGEGALLAAMVAAQNPGSVDFVVSLAGPGLKGLDLMLLNDRLQFERQKLSAADLETLTRYDRRFYDTVLAHPRPGQFVPLLQALQAQLAPQDQDLIRRYASQGTLSLAAARAPLERARLAADAPAAWRQVRCPVLALAGSLDTEVPAQENLAGIRAALQEARNKHIELVSLPELNHLLQHARTGLPEEYGTGQETISPDALHRVALFVYYTALAQSQASPPKLTAGRPISMGPNPDWPMPIGIALIFMAIGATLVSLVYIVSRHRRAQTALQHKTALELAQRGLPLPPGLLADTGVSRFYSDLRWGLVLTAVGIGAIAFALSLPYHPAWGLGFIPLFAGLGLLITYLVGKPKQSSSGPG